MRFVYCFLNLRPLLYLSFIFCAAFFLFSDAFFYPFIQLDTSLYVVNNLVIRHFNLESIFYILFNPIIYWMPFTWFIYLAEFHFFGLNPLGYRFVNLFFHCCNGALLFFIIRKFLMVYFRSKASGILHFSSFLMTLFWVIHPLRVESVIWVANLKGLCVAFWLFLFFLIYLYRPLFKGRIYFLALFLFVMALFSHPFAVMFPIILVVMDLFLYSRYQFFNFIFFKRSLIHKWPFFVLSLLFGGVTILEHIQWGGVTTSFDNKMWYFIPDIFNRYFFYLSKTFVPIDLKLLYFDVFSDWNSMGVWIGGGWLVLFSFFYRRLKPLIIVFLCCFFLLLPVLGIIQSGSMLVGNRWSYLSTISFYIFFAGVLYYILKRYQRSYLTVFLIGGTLFLLLFFQSVQQAGLWKSNDLLYGDISDSFEGVHHFVVEYNAYQAMYNDDYERALQLFEFLAPHYSYAKIGMVTAYFNQNKFEKGKVILEGTEVPEGSFMFDQKLYLLAYYYFSQGDYEQVISLLVPAQLRHQQTNNFYFQVYLDTLLLLGKSYLKLQDFEKAEYYFLTIVDFYPNHFVGSTSLAALFFKQSRYDDLFDFLIKMMDQNKTVVEFQILYAEYCRDVSGITHDLVLKKKGERVIQGLTDQYFDLTKLLPDGR